MTGRGTYPSRMADPARYSARCRRLRRRRARRRTAQLQRVLLGAALLLLWAALRTGL